MTGPPQQIGTDLKQPLLHVQPLLSPCCLWAHGQLQAPSQGTAGSCRCSATQSGCPASGAAGAACTSASRQGSCAAGKAWWQQDACCRSQVAAPTTPLTAAPQCKQPVMCAWQPLRPTLPSGVPCTAPEAQHGEQAPCDWSSFSKAHCQLQHIHHAQHRTRGRLAAAAGTHSANLQDRELFLRAQHRRPAASLPATQPELKTNACASALFWGFRLTQTMQDLLFRVWPTSHGAPTPAPSCHTRAAQQQLSSQPHAWPACAASRPPAPSAVQGPC